MHLILNLYQCKELTAILGIFVFINIYLFLGLYLDAQAGMKYLLQLPFIDKTKIIVFGRSLGGAVAIDLVSHNEFSKYVMVLIVENTFTSIPDMAKEMFHSKVIGWLPTWAFNNQVGFIDTL